MQDRRPLIRPVLALCLALGLLAARPAAALTITPVTSDNGYPALQVQWTDSAGLPRTAIMVEQTNTAPYTGFLRRYTYQVNGTNRVCTGTQNYRTGGDLEFSGDGFVQNHQAYSDGDFSSGNGAGVTGTTAVTLLGSSHALITFSMPTYTINGPYYKPVNQRTIPTTVQWFFADGRSHPIFAISQDARSAGGNLGADSRSPYGDMAYDGDGTGAYVGGCSYGDTYKFVTLAANEVTTNSGWRYTEANTIPYTMQWANPATVDAEMGHVATLPISLSDQGLDSQWYNDNGNNLNNNGVSSYYQDNRGLSATGGPMMPDDTWAYQILNDNWPASGPTTLKRLTWGANWGRVGGFDDYAAAYNTPPNTPVIPDSENTNYTQHATDPVGNPAYPNYKGAGNTADGSLMAYSVFVVLGTHTGGYTNGTVGQQVIQMQNVALAGLTAATGTVKTSGPAGVGNATNRTITYSPAGYNPTYAAWEITALTNAVHATLTPAANSPLSQPLFIIDNYTNSSLPASISLNAVTGTNGADYYASVDTSGQRLWLTLNRTVTNALTLAINGAGGGSATPAPAITSFTPGSGAAGTSVTLTGTNFTGATAVAFNGTAASFIVNSNTQITATVPVGAATGTLSVTTPGGTATSTASFTVPVVTTGNLLIYADSLLNGFQDYSWATNVNDFNTSPVYAGSDSIAVTASSYTALSLYRTNFSTAPYASLSFWIRGGTGGASGLQVLGVTNTTGSSQAYGNYYNLPAVPASAWTQFNIPLSALGVANVTNCDGFWFWPTLAGATTFYVDSIQLNTSSVPVLTAVSPKPVAGAFVLQLSGFSGQSYRIQTSTNLAIWTTVSTNTLTSASLNITNPVSGTPARQFWRAVWP